MENKFNFEEYINESFTKHWKERVSLLDTESRTAEYSQRQKNGWECKKLIISTEKGKIGKEDIDIENIETLLGFSKKEFATRFSESLEVFLSSTALEKKFETYKDHTILDMGVVLIEGKKFSKNRFFAPDIINTLDGIDVKYTGSRLWAYIRKGRPSTFIFSDWPDEDVIKANSRPRNRMDGVIYAKMDNEEYAKKYIHLERLHSNTDVCFTIYNVDNWKDLVISQAEEKSFKPEYKDLEKKELSDDEKDRAKWKSLL